MTWPEAREKAQAGLHVRRETWPAACWLIYQRGIAWYWDGMIWRIVEAEDFGVEEWEATDWTHVPREMDNCCIPVTFEACDGRWSHFTGFANPNLSATNVRLISRAPAIIELRMDSPEMGLNDGVWVPLNQGVGTEAVWGWVEAHPRNASALPWEWEWVPVTEWIPPFGSAESFFTGRARVQLSPAKQGTWEALDHTFVLPVDGHFSLRTLAGKHAANVPLEIVVCFGAQIPPYDPAKPEVEYAQGDPCAPPVQPLPPTILPPPLKQTVCERYIYPARPRWELDSSIFGEREVRNPFGGWCRATITDGKPDWYPGGAGWVGIDDALVINGEFVEGWVTAHSGVNYSLLLPPGGSFTLAGVDTAGGNVWYNLRVCMTPIDVS